MLYLNVKKLGYKLGVHHSIISSRCHLYFSGTYCPEGSSAPIPCTAGQYCDIDELDSPTGNCTAGYYCDISEVVPNPAECSLGRYCPSGTPIEIQCDPGTFNSKLFSIIFVITMINSYHARGDFCHLLITFAKQFGPRSGPTECRS